MSDFGEIRPIDSIAENILQKRYYHAGETNWDQVVDRVVDWVVPQQTSWKETAREMMRNRYFIPNSPCLVNAGKKDGGLSACFVVGFEDSILGIYKTKLDFALIAKKGGGCGTTLSNIRPENDFVSGSTHGYAGGPVKFFETICYDMKAMTQAGFREMAMMGVMYYKHPDIMKFIRAKVEEGRMHTTNISVGVDSEFMELVKSNGTYWTEFNGIKYAEVSAREVFQAIVDGAWSNGEPGIVFLDRMNDSPYKYSGQKIEATNPCVAKGTLVKTPSGEVPVELLSVGDEISTIGGVGLIDSIEVHKNYPVKKIVFGNGVTLKVTGGHIFHVMTPSGFDNTITVSDLFVGDFVRGENDALIDIVSISDDGFDTVYDLHEPVTDTWITSGIVNRGCGEQPLPANGVCNLGSLDLSKFVSEGKIDWDKLATAVKVGVRFLDSVIDISAFPTDDITQWVKDNRPVGLGYMGFADLLLEMGVAYGSPKSLEVASEVGEFIKTVAENESCRLGSEMGVPSACLNLPIPRRNVTVVSIAPTGTISLIAGCSNGVEPIFSEFTIRSDKTGTYKIEHKNSHDPYFRCAVSGNGGIEVTWQEHVLMQNEVQKHVDSGVSKTINFPNSATKEEVESAFMMAYDLGAVKGMTVYRNGSRQVEVLSPKMINKEKKCPECGGTLVKEGGCTHCDKCEYSFCEVS